MTARALAWRTIRQYPMRALLAVAGVAFIGALLFDMLMLSHGLVDSFADLLDHAGYDVRVMAGEGLSLTRTRVVDATRLAASIAKLPQVRAVSVLRIERAVLPSANGRADRDVTLLGSDAGGSHSGWILTAGADLPAAGQGVRGGRDGRDRRDRRDGQEANCPLVVSRRLATSHGVAIGSTLRIRPTPHGAAAMPAVSCPVIGVADFLFSAVDEDNVATTLDGVRAITGDASDEADFIFVSSAEGTSASDTARAIAPLRADVHAYSNEDVLALFNRNSFAYFRQISFVLTSLTLVFAFLLVSTLLTVATNQRLGEIAALRALGISRRSVSAMLLWESALLVVCGALAALPLGGGVAVWLDRILRQMPGVPERLHFFVFEPRAVAWHLALLALTGGVAAAYPVWLAARLPIAPTLRREVVG